MDLGWFVLSVFLFIEILLVTLVCMPMPSNEVRGAVNGWVASLWLYQPVQYAAIGMLAVDVFYLCFVWQALSNPLYDMGFFSHEMGVSCEYKQDLYLAERNAYISASILFLFFVLRRLVDIQDKLHMARSQVKAIQGGGGAGGDALLMDGSHKKPLAVEADDKKAK
ncbi:expressed unknown protein [Seminavis robusta]|uniref:Endoplasmic reticulum transmembrane protein n=1 Tax=Seminavis robusta TaxID=568900 RepID=A0A9N8DEW6_9STRA|nr:expressed unknown protein [Seminavis robusta]|eukprot:Sro116_g057160.1 n/a (166) ;mRNA; f:86991-87488